MQLDGAHVLITGGSRGIGAAMAREFTRAGARVSLVARSAAAIETLAAELGGAAFPGDLLDAAMVDELIARVERNAGPVDVLVNNAGVETTAAHSRLTVDELRNTARLNLEVPMVLTRAVLPGMIDRNRGQLVFVSSLAGTSAVPFMAAYAATKSGLRHFAASLRIELRDTAIGATVVAPGPVDTAMWDEVEHADEIQPTLRRFRRMQILPKKSPELIARRTVAAVADGRRHVRTPRRLTTMFVLGESPSRMTEWLLTGVPMLAPSQAIVSPPEADNV